LDCGGVGVSSRCDATHLIGSSAAASIRGLNLPIEPSGLAVAPLATGDALVVPHLTSQSASLIVNRWSDAGPFGPSLEFVLGGLPEGPSGVVHLPVPELVRASEGASRTARLSSSATATRPLSAWCVSTTTRGRSRLAPSSRGSRRSAFR
jgi:hypothetical protein